MHDETFERRLRDALRDQADRQPFTITAAELGRRVSLRGRSAGSRRLTLLLAAATAIGLIGAGSMIGGLANVPAPSSSPIAVNTQPSRSADPSAAPTALISLHDLIDVAGRETLQVAQSRDPRTDGPRELQLEPARVSLGSIAGNGLEVLVACDAEAGGLELDIRFGGGSGPATGPTIPCDRAIHVVEVARDDEQALLFTAPAQAAWRVVAHGANRRVSGSEGPEVALEDESQEELTRLESMQVEPSFPEPGVSRWHHEIDTLPARWSYDVGLWCANGDSVRYVHGDHIEGTFVSAMDLEVPCDGRVHRSRLDYPEPNGTRAFISASPETTWSVVVTAEEPPVGLVDQAGWVLAAGLGPDLAFETLTSSFSGIAAEGGGPLQVSMDCAGSGAVEVEVDLQATTGSGTFVANCTTAGTLSSVTFEAPRYEDVHVEYGARPGVWTALSILIPEREVTSE